MFEKLYGVSLFVPTFPGTPEMRFQSFKSFCSDPLERKKHPWDGCYKKMSKSSRLSLQHSLFLFRKTLPAKCPDVFELMDRLSSPPSPPPQSLLDFVEVEVRRLFPVEWDKSYDKRVQRAVVSTSACSQNPRSKGGSRMYWMEKYQSEAREEFCSYLVGKALPSRPPPSKLTAVDTGGKVRVLTVPPAEFGLLQPLSSAMYDRLSMNKWLLRGDAKATRFEGFSRVKGEVFVSGDYESATDNLNLILQKRILQVVLSQCRRVPPSIQGLALDSMTSELTYSGEGSPPRTIRLENGQMMGFLPSFPLLCLTNYLVFRWSVGWNCPVRINGDDIVFRARPEVARHWMEKVEASGLKLSVGKTMVDRTFFTLNSALFKSSESGVKSVPFIRSKALFGKEDSFSSLPGRWGSFAPGFVGQRRHHARCTFLRWNAGFLAKSGRSLNRGLQIRVNEPVLKGSRLWERECSLLSLPVEKPPPMTRSAWESAPQGYEIKYGEKKKIYSKEEKEELLDAIVDAAWCPPKKLDYDGYYTGGSSVPRLDRSKAARLLRISRVNVDRMLERRNLSIFETFRSSFKRKYPFWSKQKSPLVPADEGTEENFEVVRLDLGRGTLWDCRSSDPVLVQAYPGCRIKAFKGGVGIGPPTCF